MKKVIGLLFLVLLMGGAACRRSETTSISAQDRQRLNHALSYFLYAQANVQLERLPVRHPVRLQEANARTWVIRGLRQPEREVSQQTVGVNAGFSAGLSLSGTWTRMYIDNPHAGTADAMIQLFNDTRASWDRQQHLWHLGGEYKTDYEWARNEDRFKFPPAFYQDPYPDTTQRSQ